MYLFNLKSFMFSLKIIQEIFPVSTYTCFGLTIVMFLVTDYLRYKPIVILNAFSNCTVQIFLIFTRSITDMKVGKSLLY